MCFPLHTSQSHVVNTRRDLTLFHGSLHFTPTNLSKRILRPTSSSPTPYSRVPNRDTSNTMSGFLNSIGQVSGLDSNAQLHCCELNVLVVSEHRSGPLRLQASSNTLIPYLPQGPSSVRTRSARHPRPNRSTSASHSSRLRL
jgi:hypothetical protein